MQITITFDNLNEFHRFTRGVMEAEEAKAQEAPKIAPESDEKPKVKKNPKPTEKPASAKKTEPDEFPEPQVTAGPQEAAPVLSEAEAEALMVETRKILTQLNKISGKKLAGKLVREYGVEKLTLVKPEDLPELRQRAEKMLMDYEEEESNA